MNISRQRNLSQRGPKSQRGHIVQNSLNRKNQLIDKYQNQIQDLIQKIDAKVPSKRTVTNTSGNSNNLRSVKRTRLSSSFVNDKNDTDKQMIVSGSMKDYQKLILGLEYALQGERKKSQSLGQKNNSLELQISNLRNVLVGPNQSRQYQKTILRQLQQKINQLEDKAIDQKRNYQFIIDSKNQAITSLQTELRTVQKDFQSQFNKKQKSQLSKQSALAKRVVQLMNSLQEMRAAINQKNILIQSLKYRKIQFHADSGDQSDEQIKKIHNAQKIKFYLGQMEISNNMIIKKNIQILNLSNKLLKFQEVIDVIEMYLDKKEVKNIDLNILQTNVITKLRILLRQKATFQRQLLSQLNQHNKKISAFQNQVTSKQSMTTSKLSEVIADNKKLTALVASLQVNIKNLEKSLNDQNRQNQYLKNQIQINKKQFVEEIKRMKGDLGTISSVTKNQFDRMKIENLKLSQQNRSLLFLVGEKERQIHRKGQSIRTFQDYKQKINSLDLGIKQIEKRKIEKVGEQTPQIGSKILLINTFSGWMFEWNKIKSWSNKKVLLNLFLDKQQIRSDALSQINMLIDVLHQCLLHSKNVQIQQRAIIIVSYFLSHGLMKHSSFYLDKIVPILLRGFRQKIEGQQDQKHRLLNQSTLKIFSQLQKSKYVWTNEMTNEMLSINGLKFLFVTINQHPIDDIIEMCYDVLIMITKQNEMVSFVMFLFIILQLVVKNISHKYNFVIYILELLKNLLASDDFIRSQKSFLQFRKIVALLKDDDDEEVLLLSLQALQMLITNSSSFAKSLNKIQAIAVFNKVLKSHTDMKLLKKLAQVYGLALQNLEDESLDKFVKLQLEKVLKIISEKMISDERFLISLKIILKISQQVNQRNDLDQKIIGTCFQIYELYQSLEDKAKMRLNTIINTIYQRNKNIINKFSTQNFIVNLVESYKSANSIEEILILLKIILFESEQKHTTQILRSGRQNFIDKLINDCMATKNYQVSILALKNLLAIARQKYVEKFINIKLVSKIVNKALKQRGEQQYLSLTVSALYFFCKNQQISVMAIESHAVEKISEVMTERHDKQALIFKCFALIQLLHTMNYKRKVLNYFLTSDPKLQITKTFNYILRRAQNKIEMGARAVFYYDFLLGKGTIQSFAILMESNDWMIQDLISTRNEYIGKVDSLVYKIEMILNSVCERSKKLNKIYQRFKVQGDISSGDEDD